MAPDDLDGLYRDAILDHCRNPRNRALVERPDVSANAVNPFCGDEVRLQAALDSDGRISRIGLQAVGCAINQASGSMLTEAVLGRTIKEARAASDAFQAMMQGRDTAAVEGPLTALAGVKKAPVRVKCALLAWSALDDGIEDEERRRKDTSGLIPD